MVINLNILRILEYEPKLIDNVNDIAHYLTTLQFQQTKSQQKYLLRNITKMDLSQYAYSVPASRTIKNSQSFSTSIAQKGSEGYQQTTKIDKMRNKVFKIEESNDKNCEVLKTIVEWRKHRLAPVDTMGCERLFDPKAPLQIQKYQTLISLLLSVQTKDETTSMCVNRLKQYGLTPQKMLSISEQELLKLIYECNFNKRKAKNIKQISKTILTSGMARTMEGLMNYPGVGVKIATIYMNVVEGKQQGIGVDTHVHRIANRLGWCKTQDPKATQHQLQLLFPKNLWKDINIALVGFGQLVCDAKKPKCSLCPVNQSCPSALKW